MSPTLQTLKLTAADAGKTLQELLRERLKLTNRQAKALIDSRSVFVNGRRVWMARHSLQPADVVTLPAPDAVLPARTAEPVAVLWKDQWILGVNKPAGLVSESAKGSLEERLRAGEKQPGLRALHRLDKDTSGVILFAREGTDRGPYIEIFREKAVRKEYIAIVRGVPGQNQFTIQSRLDSKEAVTEVRVLTRTRTHAVVRCRIPTGRTHQIRRHLLLKDLILVGERTYGQNAPVLSPVERTIPRQMLHAALLSFICPHTGADISLKAPMFPDMELALKSLTLKGFSL
ncbi:MAG: RluA family pseudouridine synthase [Verrucomicrobia bacterium]|nr:RluA family pseudouridine synthase [Verrucomicrobiota bacterium]MCH8528962.1 RluA family pseudouridine synthase [Kiritimatiellia bacterium]